MRLTSILGSKKDSQLSLLAIVGVLLLLALELASNLALTVTAFESRYINTSVLVAYLDVPIPLELALCTALWAILQARHFRELARLLVCLLSGFLLMDTLFWIWMRVLAYGGLI